MQIHSTKTENAIMEHSDCQTAPAVVTRIDTSRWRCLPCLRSGSLSPGSVPVDPPHASLTLTPHAEAALCAPTACSSVQIMPAGKSAYLAPCQMLCLRMHAHSKMAHISKPLHAKGTLSARSMQARSG